MDADGGEGVDAPAGIVALGVLRDHGVTEAADSRRSGAKDAAEDGRGGRARCAAGHARSGRPRLAEAAGSRN